MQHSIAETIATPSGDIDVGALADTLKLPLTELAALAKVSRNSLRTDTLGPKARTALEPIVQILSLATDMMGSQPKAVFWFRYNPLIGMGARTAMQHVSDGRSEQVLLYLRNVTSGGYA